MARVVITASADQDYASILAYFGENAGRQAAAKYQEAFRDLYARLADYPELGPLRSKLGANIRIGILRPYLAIYEYFEDDDLVTIMRIVHGHRRITGKMLPPK